MGTTDIHDSLRQGEFFQEVELDVSLWYRRVKFLNASTGEETGIAFLQSDWVCVPKETVRHGKTVEVQNSNRGPGTISMLITSWEG